jgi:hypothetical protein
MGATLQREHTMMAEEDIVAAETLRLADKLERRAAATFDADDRKAAALLRLMVEAFRHQAHNEEEATRH